ncbi:hypothetical protein HZU83_15325 [Sphaerotilus montanus]|jgi:hypothetical protein|uniref:Secreted protein n=1 Tax=Sphaerotilus montanus TaxID=522889 RepID=A0A7Y9UAV7_9BURK|nr:hypothetical protein [Sphaerotilus montanus]NYG31799.1 hypothetical protein [Sphaerotilus montanus]NZD58065.1 hypothetical protein [Sphaerotilus montanus]
MSRRLLFTLFAALLLLCAGLSGAARAAVMAVHLVERVAVADSPCCAPLPSLPSGERVPNDPLPMAEPGGAVELADVPLLPGSVPALPLYLGEHLPPRPVLHAGHPAPCLDGLLRPPSRRV